MNPIHDWRDASTVMVGDKLLTDDTEQPFKRVVMVEKIDYTGPVHNIEVEDENSYILNGVAAHNCLRSPANNAPKCWSCHPGHMMVSMGDGTVQRIDTIKVGDEVLTHTGNRKKVIRVLNRQVSEDLVTLVVRDKGETIVTKEHRYLNYHYGVTPKGLLAKDDRHWVQAGDIKEATWLYSPITGFHQVIATGTQHYTGDVWHLEVEDDHTYLVNGVVCENCTACRTPEEKLSMLQRTYETSDILRNVKAYMKTTETKTRVRWLMTIHDPLFRTAPKLVLGRNISRGMMLRLNQLGLDEVNRSFLTISATSMSHAENDQQRPWVMGRIIIEMLFNDQVSEHLLRSLIPHINAQPCMAGMQVEDVRASGQMKPINTTPFYGLYELTLPDMTYYQVKNTLEKLHDHSQIMIKKKKSVNRDAFRLIEVAYTRSDMVPVISATLTGDGKPRVLFLGSSKQSPYYMLESILKRRGGVWREEPIVCHGYYLLNQELGLKTSDSPSGDIFGAMNDQELWCDNTSRPIETDFFTGMPYMSTAAPNLCVIEDHRLHTDNIGYDPKRIAAACPKADKAPELDLKNLEGVIEAEVLAVDAISADIKALT